MKHLQSKTVLEENMFGYALARKDDFMFFGGNKSRFEVLCIQFKNSQKKRHLKKNSSKMLKQKLRLPFSTGIVGLISYDDYSQQKTAENKSLF